ncbi:monovalent cation/H(+) antiporter subunit G [Aquipuribacter sp. MA13-6]|uniref:monovalent cation/H(+) antiporter subunit G n=1 Tax=unclassified Aquipuribacter TaxID=2635084 RepID=UPI003EEFEF73
MTADTFLDGLAAALLLVGASLALAAAIGTLRFPDVLMRMHAATKPQVLGIVLCLAGAAVRLREHPEAWLLLLAAGFQLVTAPVSAHMVSRVANRSRHFDRGSLHVDDLPPGRSRPLRPRQD